MHILVLGGAGMAGRKFIDHLARTGQLGGRAIAKLTAQDVVAAQAPAATPFVFDAVVSDLSQPGEAEKLVAAAHIVCPYSNATRGNIDVTLTIV